MANKFDKYTIPSGEQVQGYYWVSDSESPVIIDGPFDGMELIASSNPFVIEAQFYIKLTRISYSIKYIDGGYYVQAQPVTDEMTVNAKSFISKWDERLKLLFSTVWVAEPDPLCCNMDVLMPANCVFVGFMR